MQLRVLGAERRLERLDPLVGETPHSPSQGIERGDHTGRSGARAGAAEHAMAVDLFGGAFGDSKRPVNRLELGHLMCERCMLPLAAL